MNDENPYHVLGVKADATADQIKKAYRKQARANHPDVHQGKSPEEQNAYAQQFRRATWAYGLLCDEEHESGLAVARANKEACQERVDHLCACIGELGHWTYRADESPKSGRYNGMPLGAGMFGQAYA